MNETENINAREFLDYVARNEKRLKHNLRKNITYDSDIFHEAFQNAVLKCYNSICKNNTQIEDYEDYFFIASKFEYILLDNRKKRDTNRKEALSVLSDRVDESDTEEDNERAQKYRKEYEELRDRLLRTFTETEVNIFFNYYMSKINSERMSYETIGEEFGVSAREVADIITKIQRNLNHNSLF